MRYRFIKEGEWLFYQFHGTNYWQTWRVAFQFIRAGLRLGFTGFAAITLPHDSEEE